MADRSRTATYGIALCGILLLAPMAAGPALAQAGPSISPKKADAKPAETDTDTYIPPLRGTPDGRISGATRGAQPVTANRKIDTIN